MREHKEMRTRTRKTIGVGWKLFAFLMALVLLMLGVIWLLQIRLLNHFYQKTKYKELETISSIISDYVGTDTLDTAVYSCAVDYFTCIRIFRHSKQFAVEVASADVAEDCLIHDIPQSRLNDYYKRTKENGGLFAATEERKPKLGTFWSVSDPKTTRLFDSIKGDGKTIGMVYCVLVEGDDGAEYLIQIGRAHV